MPGPVYDSLPDNISADAVDVLGAGKSVTFIYDAALGAYRAQRSTDAQPPGNGTLLAQMTATITTASQALTGIPAGATFAQLQFRGAGVSARYDGAAASNSAAEEQYAAGGTLRLTNAADIAGFRYIGTGAGSISILYRSS